MPDTKVQDINVQTFDVEKANLQTTRLTTSTITITMPLGENEVVLKVDKFALTANNISYGVAGDSLGYGRFFPTEQASEKQWDRLPVMGFADVITANTITANTWKIMQIMSL